ncbi:MAG TPA: prolyl oligopeptidase family serine peptidase, partial [Gemmatimonadaceae bacterium]
MEPRDGPIGFGALARLAGSAALLATALLSCAAEAAAQLTPEQLARVEWIEETAISPDGQRVAYVRSLATGPGRAARGRARDLFLIPAAGGEPRRLVSADSHPGGPAWSPDGTLLAFLGEYSAQDPHRQVYAVPRDGGEPRALTRAPSGVRGFAFSPDGRSLAYLAPEPVPDPDAERQRKGYDAVVYGEPAAHVRLWVKELSRGAPRAVTPPDRTVREFVWSPDGKAFGLQVTEGTDAISSRNFRRLYTTPAAGGELTLLARTEGQLGSMAWSPDGGYLAFVGATSLRDSTAQSLFVVPAGGGEAVDPTVGYEGAVVWVGWQDPATLLFGAIEGTRTALNRIGPAGGAVARVVGGGEESFVFFQVGVSTGLSLDAGGKMFAAPMNTSTHADELYVGTTDGSELRRLTKHNAFIEQTRLARQETIEWMAADGLRIEGVLIHPLDERTGLRYPLVVIAHGGPHAAWVNSFFMTFPQAPGQVFAGRDYAVLYPNFRGSIGRGVAFSRANQGDMGGKDLQDILAGVDHLIRKGLVDADRVA